MVLNQQRRIAVDLNEARGFVRRLRAALKLTRRDFNVCFVDDARIAELNARYRHKARPTDVLSFPWSAAREGTAPPQAVSPVTGRRAGRASVHRAPLQRAPTGSRRSPRQRNEFSGFLGDVVISAETARRNALAATHSTAKEIRGLILHGVLHLLGYDHESDRGEMKALELALRERLGT